MHEGFIGCFELLAVLNEFLSESDIRLSKFNFFCHHHAPDSVLLLSIFDNSGWAI